MTSPRSSLREPPPRGRRALGAARRARVGPPEARWASLPRGGAAPLGRPGGRGWFPPKLAGRASPRGRRALGAARRRRGSPTVPASEGTRVRELYVGVMSGTSLDGVDAVGGRLRRGSRAGRARRSAPPSRPIPSGSGARRWRSTRQGGRQARPCRAPRPTLARALRGPRCASYSGGGIDRTLVAADRAATADRTPPPDLGYTVQLVNGALLAELAGRHRRVPTSATATSPPAGRARRSSPRSTPRASPPRSAAA